MYSKYDIHDFREFADKIGWFTPEIMAMFLYGNNGTEAIKYAHNRLRDIQKAKNPAYRFKRIAGFHKKAFASPGYNKKHIGTQHALHDERLRISLAKMIQCNRGYLDHLSLEKPADANFGTLYVELDKGTETIPYIIKKINRYYLKGDFQVLFIMSVPYTTKGDAFERIIWRERLRCEHLIKEIAKIFPDKPNRILVTAYTNFLEDGTMHNFKGDIISA